MEARRIPQWRRFSRNTVARRTRVRWEDLEENLAIAQNTNAAFSMAKGGIVGLLDHDDNLAPNALYEIVNAS
ncbi:MAG: glycosyltransferase [Blautia sp.]